MIWGQTAGKSLMMRYAFFLPSYAELTHSCRVEIADASISFRCLVLNMLKGVRCCRHESMCMIN